MRRQTATPRTLLPCSSSRGENTATPSSPGSTARMPPATPLLAGMPTPSTHAPAPSYMPHVVITLSTRSTSSGASARCAGTRLLAAVGQRRRHQRDVAAVDQHRALAEVALQHRLGVLLEDREAAQHVPDRAVAVAGLALGGEDRLVHLQGPAGVAAVGLQHAREALRRRVAGHQRRRGDRAGVDHRVARAGQVRSVFRLQADGVERVTRRLDADLGHDRVAAPVGQRQAVGERLGHRLDGERGARVADLVDVPVGGGHADPEALGVGAGQRRDVVGHRPVAQFEVLGVQPLEVVLDGGAGHRRASLSAEAAQGRRAAADDRVDSPLPSRPLPPDR